MNRILYFISRNFARWLCLTLWKMEVWGEDNVPTRGGVIVAANHRSLVDPPVIASAVSRVVHFMAKEELFSFRPFGWFITQLNAHPLRRSGDVRAFKTALRLIRSGEAVILFPEGRRSKTDELQRGKAGVGLLSKTTGCPVVPVYIHNTGHLKRFKKIQVHIARPILPEAYETDQQLADAVMEEIRKMKDHVGVEI